MRSYPQLAVAEARSYQTLRQVDLANLSSSGRSQVRVSSTERVLSCSAWLRTTVGSVMGRNCRRPLLALQLVDAVGALGGPPQICLGACALTERANRYG